MSANKSVSKTVTIVCNPGQSEIYHDALCMLQDEYGPVFKPKLYYTNDINEGKFDRKQLALDIESADLLILELMGAGAFMGMARQIVSRGTQLVLVINGGPDAMTLMRLGPEPMKVDAKHHAAMSLEYWHCGDAVNRRHMLALLGHYYLELALPVPPVPQEPVPQGVFDPQTRACYESREEYWQEFPPISGAPTVGLLCYGGSHFLQSAVPAQALAEELCAKHRINVLPVFAERNHNHSAIEKYFMKDGVACVDAVVSFQYFQLSTFTQDKAQDTVSLLKDLDVPVFCACPLYHRDIKEWQESPQGFGPMTVMIGIILPELDGMIEPIPLAGLIRQKSELFACEVSRLVPIPDRVSRVAERIANWICLKQTPNKKRRIAVIIYDNPGGEGHLGSAAYLDTLQSVREILIAFANDGYDVQDIPVENDLKNRFIHGGILNHGEWIEPDLTKHANTLYPFQQYERALGQIPAESAKEAKDVAREAASDLMRTGSGFFVPHISFGNVMVGLQPARGGGANAEQLAHDKSLPPPDHYIAWYRWLETVWKPHAMIHVGTHGTLEFLRGKEAGMTQHCWPEILTGSIPHLYIYHVTNASEAVIAKRRSLATLVNYNTPSFTTSGLYEEYCELDDCLQELQEAKSIASDERVRRLTESVMEKAAKLNIPCQTPDTVAEELALMKRSIIPKGLHTFGHDIEFDDRVLFGAYLLRIDREEVPSLHRLKAEAAGLDYDTLLDGNDIVAMEKIDAEVCANVAAAMSGGAVSVPEDQRRCLDFACKVGLDLDGWQEMHALLEGLNMKYVTPGLGGDPLRTPEVLPTGRNTYQFDPRLVPSKDAIARGEEITNNIINTYREEHGTYPDSIGIILWGFETSKTRGETIGQIFAAIGVRLTKDSMPTRKKVEAIPLDELGHPRIDCHIQICGFFRDMYPNMIALIHDAFELVSSLDENAEENHVRKNTDEIFQQLPEDLSPMQRREQSVGRIYGPPAGEYGNSLSKLIQGSNWESEEEISGLFMKRSQHLYARSTMGEVAAESYKRRLQTVDTVSQVRDTHEREINELDHYFEYFGGLSRSVESVRGTAPMMLITDTTRERIKTETIQNAIGRGVRTRLHNPVWIDGMLAHDYHGTQKIAEMVENLLGFSATTHGVENWVWDKTTDRFVRDREMFDRLKENNPYVTEEMLRRLHEASDRGYWDASDDDLSLLRDRILEMEGDLEEAADLSCQLS